MPRKAAVDRPVRLETTLPESVYSRLRLHLHSELENKVPKGKFQEFFVERIKEFFDSRRIELTPYGMPEGFYVYGPKEMIDALERKLRGK